MGSRGTGRPGEATESQEPGSAGADRSRHAARQAPASPQPGFGSAVALPHAELSDAELLKLHIDGDPDAFGELFSRHRDRLWAVAVRTLNDPEDAADALQDAMISAFRRAASFRGESAVTTWLHRIVVNACLDRMRRRTARPEVASGDERLLDTIAPADVGADPAAASEMSLEVLAALRQLPHDQQVALVLVDMLDYPVADAAEIIGVAQGTVKSRCARGRARLLPRLAHLRHSGDSTARPSVAGQPGRPARPDIPGQPGRPARPDIPGQPGRPARPDIPGQPSGPGERSPGEPSPGEPSPGEPAGPAPADPSAGPAHGPRNRFAPGSVLPARNGGDEEE